MLMMPRSLFAMALLACVAVGAAQTGSLTMDSRANIFGYGLSTPAPAGGGGGVLAPRIALAAGTGRTVTFSASGTAGWGGSITNGPDGGLFANTTTLTGVGPISGYSGPLSGMLVGLFIESGDISGLSAPGNADYSGANPYAATNYAPLLRQTFFIGDGLTGTGTGSLQTFAIPDAAGFMVFGIADGFGFFGSPGFYDDNVGSFDISYSAVPEPASLVILGLGMAALRRRRA